MRKFEHEQSRCAQSTLSGRERMSFGFVLHFLYVIGLEYVSFFIMRFNYISIKLYWNIVYTNNVFDKIFIVN